MRVGRLRGLFHKSLSPRMGGLAHGLSISTYFDMGRGNIWVFGKIRGYQFGGVPIIRTIVDIIGVSLFGEVTIDFD